MERHWNVDLRLCVLTYTVHDVRTVSYLGLNVSMDSLTLTLARFSQRYLANVLLEQMKTVTQWEYDNQKMNIFIFIGIGVECLGTFCSILVGFRTLNKINSIAHPPRTPGISVTSTPGTFFSIFCKPADAFHLYIHIIYLSIYIYSICKG